MAKVIVDISELRRGDGEKVEELTKLLKEKVSAKVEVATGEITINYGKDESSLPRTYVRVILKKFLYKTGLKDDFRVIAGKENSFVIKKLPEVEEEK